MVHSEITSYSIHYMYYDTVYTLMNKQTKQCRNNVDVSLDFNCAWLCTERMSGRFRKSPSWCCRLVHRMSRSGKAAPAVLCAVAAAGARSLLLSAVSHTVTLWQKTDLKSADLLWNVCVAVVRRTNGLCVALPTFLALMQTLMFRCSQYFCLVKLRHPD